jgi:hypothetical protein
MPSGTWYVCPLVAVAVPEYTALVQAGIGSPLADTVAQDPFDEQVCALAAIVTNPAAPSRTIALVLQDRTFRAPMLTSLRLDRVR